MILLDEQYDGEIISLKKGKNGLVTIKIQTNKKQGEQKNGIFRDLIGKLGRNSGRNRNDNRSFHRNEEETNGRGNQGGRGSQAGEEIASGHSKIDESRSGAEKGHGKGADGSGEIT